MEQMMNNEQDPVAEMAQNVGCYITTKAEEGKKNRLVEALCQFHFQGYVISISTYPENVRTKSQIAILDPKSYSFIGVVDTVEDAITKITMRRLKEFVAQMKAAEEIKEITASAIN